MDPPSSSFVQDEPDAPHPSGLRRPTIFDPPTQAHAIKALEGVFFSFMLIAVAIRLHVRAAITKRWGWDDYTCVIAACGSIAHMIITMQVVEIGSGRQWYDIPVASSSRIWSANSVIYPWTIAFARISILLLCLRTFGAEQRMGYAAWTGIVVQAVCYSTIMSVGVARIVKCNGLAHEATRQFCGNVARPLDAVINAINFASDFYVTYIPFLWVYCVTKTHLSRHRRWGVGVLCCCGLAIILVSLLRMNALLFDNSPDFLWGITIVHMNTMIIFACVSTFPDFYNKVLSSQLTSMAQSRVGIDSRTTSCGSSCSSSNGFQTLHGKAALASDVGN